MERQAARKYRRLILTSGCDYRCKMAPSREKNHVFIDEGLRCEVNGGARPSSGALKVAKRIEALM
jgi:hypothetical protein